MIKFFPLFFILLWSSAFISGKVIVEDASPFAALTFRFALVTIGFFLYSFLKKEKIIAPFKYLFESFSTGVLFHGIYLGGCWYAFSIGMPAAIVALIVTLQPILTNILSGPLFNEKITGEKENNLLIAQTLGENIINKRLRNFLTETLNSFFIIW